MDDPEWIVWLMEQKPKFQSMYREAYEMCRNVEAIMGYFSEELRILDRNTVQLMIDEMQDRIDRQKEQIVEDAKQLGEKDKLLGEQTKQLDEQTKQLDEQKALFDKQLSDKDAEIERLKKLLASSQTAE